MGFATLGLLFSPFTKDGGAALPHDACCEAENGTVKVCCGACCTVVVEGICSGASVVVEGMSWGVSVEEVCVEGYWAGDERGQGTVGGMGAGPSEDSEPLRQ